VQSILAFVHLGMQECAHAYMFMSLKDIFQRKIICTMGSVKKSLIANSLGIFRGQWESGRIYPWAWGHWYLLQIRCGSV